MEGVDKNDGKLVSMSADQYLRFWNLNELSGGKQPSFKYYCKHNPYGDNDLDGLSAIQLTQDNTTLLTGDTSGQLKCWDISEVDFDDQKSDCKFIEKFFIIAHKSTINSIQIVD